MHSHRKYGLLAPEEPEEGQAKTGPRARGDSHRSTRGTAEEGQTEAKTGQRVLLACGMQEEGNEVQRTPDRSRALNVCGHPGGEEGGGTLTQQRAPTVRSQGPEGDPLTRQRAILARSHGRQTVRGPPTQQRAQTARWQGGEGATSERPCATPARSQGEEEEGDPPEP